MTTNRFLTLVSGVQRLVTAIAASTGVGDANKIVATGSDGRLDVTLLPTGIGQATQAIATSENLSGGDFVNIFNNAGTPTARRADASNNRPAHGFVLAATTSPAVATVFFQGFNTGLTSLTPGARYYLSAATPGGATTTAPAPTAIVQALGNAINATTINFEFDAPIEQS